jgi:outer membrane murein-binding lipoprotein Lpp
VLADRKFVIAALATGLALLPACRSKNPDSLVGKNIDMNAIVDTNSADLNAAGNVSGMEAARPTNEVAPPKLTAPKTSTVQERANSSSSATSAMNVGNSEAPDESTVNQASDGPHQLSNQE